MDTLNLSSVFSRVRNPQGVRRWGFWEQRPAKVPAAPARLTQELMVAGQNFGLNNLPPTQFYPDNATETVQPLAGQDWWVRPAARWFQVNVSLSGAGVLIAATVGDPFVVTDPVDFLVHPTAPYQISARVGEDITLDYGAGVTYELKITSVTPNTVTAVPKTGGVVPPAALGVFAFHRLDAYFLEMTVTFIVPTSEINPALGVDLQVRPSMRLVYYKDSGNPINQDFQSVRIRSLAGTPTYVATPVTGDRFGVATGTSYSQIAELFQIVVARVPDELQLVMTQTWIVRGRFANPAIYMGDMVNVSVPVVTNLLAAAPANTVDQQQYAPVDPLDAFSAGGDIIMVSAGQQCPPGYENVAQVDSLFNNNFVKAEGALPNAGQAAAITFTITFASGVTNFTGSLPHTSPASHSLAGPQNNGATYELLVIRNGKRLSYRIPRIVFSATGGISFSVPDDLRFLIDVPANKITAYLFQSGLLLRSSMAEAGTYSKPFVSDVNLQLTQWSFSDDGVQVTQGLTGSGLDGLAWLDRVPVANAELFAVNDVLSFRDSSGALLAAPALTSFLSGPGARNLAALAANYPFGPSFRVVAVNIQEGYLVLASLAGTAADVTNYVVTNAAVQVDLSGYIIDFDNGSGAPYDTNPPTFKDNYYRIERGSVEHVHLIDISADQQIKVYNPGGHWVSKAEHYHAMTPEPVVPPYIKMLLCSRL